MNIKSTSVLHKPSENIDSFKKLELVNKLIEDITLSYNFDTFQLVFQLLSFQLDNKITLEKAFTKFKPELLKTTEMYKGSNCTGLSMLLKEKLKKQGISSIIIPSFDTHTDLIKNNSNNIKTVDILTRFRSDRNDFNILFAPGLMIGEAVKLINGERVNSYGRSYKVEIISQYEFKLLTYKNQNSSRERYFRLSEFRNINKLTQQNLPKSLDKLVIKRQYLDHDDQIAFNLTSKKFTIILDNQKSIMNPTEFLKYFSTNFASLHARFHNNYLLKGFGLLIQNLESIRTFAIGVSKINWDLSPELITKHIDEHIAFSKPWTIISGKRMLVMEVVKVENELSSLIVEGNNGNLLGLKKRLFVQAGGNLIEILKLQVEGKKIVTAKEFLNGYQNLLPIKLL